MSKILTAEEYAMETMQGTDMDEITSALVGFARMHVREALVAATEKARMSGKWGNDTVELEDINITDNDGNWLLLEINKEAILKAYPIQNIK